MTDTYTLTSAEVSAFDCDDQRRSDALMRDLRARFGSPCQTDGGDIATEIVHPDDDYVITILYRAVDAQ